eukprot:m.37402 g.37402  ORF g.37402 m.37402 type:complete len:285 (+) comp7689_c0_seq1:452-1306(+)
MPKEEREYKCDLCDYTATHRSNLSRHVQRHSNPFACTYCDYRAEEQAQLEKHTRRHTRERPHACKLCSYRATKKSDLRAHLRVHTGERPHACTFCDYRAAHKSTLTAHLRRHVGEKPHACDVCPYRSTTKSDLTKHKRVHERDAALAAQGRLFVANSPAASTAAAAASASGSGQQRKPAASKGRGKGKVALQAVAGPNGALVMAVAAAALTPHESPQHAPANTRSLSKRRGQQAPPPLLHDRLRPYRDGLLRGGGGAVESPMTPISSTGSPGTGSPRQQYGFAL